MRIIIVIAICLLLTIQDIKYRMIYSPLNCLLLIVGLATNNNLLILNILGIVLIPIILFLINYFYREIIGDGDIEFISAAGLLLGFVNQNIMLLISCVLAIIYMTITKKKSIPMIPFLSIGLIICLFL